MLMNRDNKPICRICQRHASQYTCPKCNVPYCSLACFRSEKHSQCSEPFYRREIESQIRDRPSASEEERRQMLSVLHKFEQESLEQNSQTLGEDEVSEEDLSRRLEGIDIDSISASQLWDMLGPMERSSFLKVVRDPRSASSREFMNNINLEEIMTLPWWEAPIGREEEPDQSRVKYGSRPSIIQIPSSLLRPPGPETGPPLLYNTCAVLIAYAYATRHFGVSPLHSIGEDAGVARKTIRDLVPFLADKHSRVILTSMDDVVSETWPRLVDTEKVERSLFVLLLSDTVCLLSPQKVIPISAEETRLNGTSKSLETSPHRNALAALSDLYMLFHARLERKETPTTAKIRFYAAHITVLPPLLIGSFTAEVQARKQKIEMEVQEVPPSTEYKPSLDADTMGTKQPGSIPGKSKPIIEVLESR